MGHSIHGLYTVDFLKPKFAWSGPVPIADTYAAPINARIQRQVIDRVVFEQKPEAKLVVQVYVRHGSITLRREDPPWPEPTLKAYRIDFQLVGDFFKVTPETAAAGRLLNLK
jgi:hypothetical protein